MNPYDYRNPYAGVNDQRFFAWPLFGGFVGGLLGGALAAPLFYRPFYGYPGFGYPGYPYYY